MKKIIYSEDFFKDLKKKRNINWLKVIGWIGVTLFAGHKTIDSAFKVGVYKGGEIVAEVTNNDYATEEEEEN